MVESTSPGESYGGPEEALFVPGVDYVSAWREANEGAQELNTAVEGLGLDPRIVRAIGHAGANGEPVVWMRPEGARLIARALDAVAKGRRAS